MVTLQATSDKEKIIHADCILYLILEDTFSPHTAYDTLSLITKTTIPHLEKHITKQKFEAKFKQVCTIPFITQEQVRHLICIGLGKQDINHASNVEHLRRALAIGIAQAKKHHTQSVAIVTPTDAHFINKDFEYIATQTSIITHMSLYGLSEFISKKDTSDTTIDNFLLYTPESAIKEAQSGITKGNAIAHATNQTRYWVDLPPNHANPDFMAHKAKEIAQQKNLTCTIFNENEIIAMGMGGLAGVSKGSDVDCKLIILEYHTAIKNAPTLAFVGKGITFDSGGLSLKPAESMESMKDDMAGAAAVISAIEALAELKPSVNIIAVAPISENLPSGKATKPGDVLKFYNGMTAEIKNTDAEGRLILADALSYTVKKYNPTIIIDIATLTGACAYALGPYFSGLMGNDTALIKKIEQAAERSGDPVWQLPMTNDYKAAIKSEIADICNIGSKSVRAGAITAAHFLENFIDKTPWAHLDIAGTAFGVPGIPYFNSGATGASVRLLIELALNWK